MAAILLQGKDLEKLPTDVANFRKEQHTKVVKRCLEKVGYADSNNASESRGSKPKKVVDPSMPSFDLDIELHNSAESKLGGKGDDKDCNTVTHICSEFEEAIDPL
ncbi:hypothetical protein DM860_006922 [Cuscuta australis]|uniref:Uncharacterized protein n=1 Tax=Cuscuta australis TaxID=267555 RepID=A0A328E6R4_9ASTE|nr:hypothetical protein DM860_006922 [Cuscuta australis]